ncbi:MRN complex-interacting protein isoform X2 [Notolabrus celidotus]|uniref:MRN complex-interacting protein isoform X2 n=1 Tax=Notolabrus celidotus TaxID=1203425 RepID=UPI00148F8F2F|nr:MRN complex-interacting protein isoform X2 [Notolabrus celidotus]
MVQEFHVLRCFSCQSFQVQQVKKVHRWSCKLCGEKQSLLKEFGRGSGADCRRHVQKLNAARGNMMEEQERSTLSLWNQAEEEERRDPEEEEWRDPEEEEQVSQPQVSRWSKYLDTPEEEEEPEDEDEDEQRVSMERDLLHGNHMTDRKRKRGGERESCTPEQHQPGSMRPAKTTRTMNLTRAGLTQTRTTSPTQTTNTNLNQTGLTQTRTTDLNPRGLTQARTTSLNQTGLTQTRTTDLNPRGLTQARTTSLNQTGPNKNWSSPLCEGAVKPPSVNSGLVSRWSCFLRSDSEVQEGEGASDSGWSHKVGEASSLTCSDVITQPLARPRPLLPVSSIFESGDEFCFDDFLSGDF